MKYIRTIFYSLLLCSFTISISLAAGCISSNYPLNEKELKQPHEDTPVTELEPSPDENNIPGPMEEKAPASDIPAAEPASDASYLTLTPIQVGQACGYLTEDGQWAITPRFEAANPFNEHGPGSGKIRFQAIWLYKPERKYCY